MMQWLRYAGGTIVRRKARRQADKFLAAAARPREVQHRVLRRLLQLNADSAFSRRHGLDRIQTPQELRARLPITDYEFYQPDIERMKLGDERALLGSANQLLMFALSSGSTGESKHIPITRRFLTDYRRGWKVWGIRAMDDHPQMHRLHILQLTSDYDQFRTPGGTPCGNISGLVGAMQSRVVQTMYTLPLLVSKIRDPEAKFYATLRIALADREVGWIMTANPSTLVQLAQFADRHRDQLLRDLADGTCRPPGEMPRELLSQIRGRCGRAGRRAAELGRIIERRGSLHLGDCWPSLQLLGVWTGGSAGAYLGQLSRCFGERIPFRDHGLSASEGRMTIPLVNGRASGLLDIGAHYFEFIPRDQHGDPHAEVLEAHELEAGQEYFILLTTSSGLYRYDICDLVRCTGHWQQTPLLEFLNKGAHISSLTGEKVTEAQAVAAVREACRELGTDLAMYTVAPVWGDPPGYRLLFERGQLPSPAAGERLARRVDQHLQMLNCEYADKRRTFRLTDLTCDELAEGTFARFARRRQQRPGGSVEQYKHPSLSPQLDFRDMLVREFGTVPQTRAA